MSEGESKPIVFPLYPDLEREKRLSVEDFTGVLQSNSFLKAKLKMRAKEVPHLHTYYYITGSEGVSSG